jgi:hypothetical protein
VSLKSLKVVLIGQGLKIGVYSALLTYWAINQIAFFVRHPKNSFVLVAGSPNPELVRLYPGSRILELVDDGLRLEPLASGLAACVALFESLGA